MSSPEVCRSEKAASTSWYNLFLQADLDDSGFITFDELREVVRKKIKKGQKAITDEALKALWCALDEVRARAPLLCVQH